MMILSSDVRFLFSYVADVFAFAVCIILDISLLSLERRAQWQFVVAKKC